MSERRTIVPRDEREWMERQVGHGGRFAEAADRLGFEALLECFMLMDAAGALWRVDLRRTPWAGNPELKKALLDARVATTALREAVEKVVWDD